MGIQEHATALVGGEVDDDEDYDNDDYNHKTQNKEAII